MKYHDLSSDLVKLDYPTLINCATMAWRNTQSQVERGINEIQSGLIPGKSLVLSAYDLADQAQRLAVAIETWEALNAIKTREKVLLTNCPDGKNKEVKIQ